MQDLLSNSISTIATHNQALPVSNFWIGEIFLAGSAPCLPAGGEIIVKEPESERLDWLR
jgi:hypothetical protein